MKENIEFILRNRERNPDGLQEGIRILEKEILEKQGVIDPYGYLSQIYYWLGEDSNTGEKKRFYEKGVEMGKLGIQKYPNSILSHFWLGTNMGLVGQENGVLSSLFLVGDVERHIRKSLELDESYFYGAPHRAWGYILFALPPWPISKGDNKKALFHMEKALHFGPKFPMNYLYMGEILYALNEKRRAREYWETLVQWPKNGYHDRENEKFQNKAKSFLERYS